MHATQAPARIEHMITERVQAATTALHQALAETGQFTVYLMRPGAFEAGGRFIPAAQKVRLLHASIRHHLQREDHWDTDSLGTPICQEDMIGGDADLEFSPVLLFAPVGSRSAATGECGERKAEGLTDQTR